MSEEIKTNTVAEENPNLWEQIRLWCYFIPIITTVAFLVYAIGGIQDGSLASIILIILMAIGWIAALITGPMRIIKLFVKWTWGGCKFGFNICPFIPLCFFTACMGFCFGFGIMSAIFNVVPAAITLYYYFNEEN